MKRILGLDLGTTSIGWALVNEAETESEQSSIIKTGARVVPLSVDEQQNFEKGKSITTNADRTLKRSMRRNLQRYKLRRENLLEILNDAGIIKAETTLSENGNASTFSTYYARAKAATQKIDLEDFAKVLLMINKKRGYKSSRKLKSDEDGMAIDGMEVAKKLYDENLTPGQYTYSLLLANKKPLPDYYRSDLKAELIRIWNKQNEFYDNALNTADLEKIIQLNKTDAKNYLAKQLETEPTEIKGNAKEKKLIRFELRAKGVTEKIELSDLVEILPEIIGEITNSSGYLGAISDRSKELIFKKQTVGEYLWAQIESSSHTRLKGQVFYRQDYLDEFETIWNEQAKHYPQLDEKLKTKIRDVVIFYQRKLKSQKGQISFCEFESKKISIEEDGKQKEKLIGSRVIPRSSPLYQEFVIWSQLNNLEIFPKGERIRQKKKVDPENPFNSRQLPLEHKENLFNELRFTGGLKKSEILKRLVKKPAEWDLNLENVDGNRTFEAIINALKKVIIAHGYDDTLFNETDSAEFSEHLKSILKDLGIDTSIIDFDSSLPPKDLEAQSSYRLWHLLYSYVEDDSKTGTEKLITSLQEKFGFNLVGAKVMSGIVFSDDYGSLSAKAIRKILPHLKEGNQYSVACEYAGYNHSHSESKEEKENRVRKDRLEILPKNALRNPVVEKILNQMINLVNAVCDEYGKPDEVRIELARELKKSAKEREKMTQAIGKATREHENIRKILKDDFGLNHISRNHIIRYKLYQELKDNGFRTLYTDTYISPDQLFGKTFDIEHIIPQARLFDDSFSNKTLELSSDNKDKGDSTAFDHVSNKGEVALKKYEENIERLFANRSIGFVKRKKLLMRQEDIPDGFIQRELRDTQYIAKKALSMLDEVFKDVLSTTGSVTEKLREDWQLINVMQELNWDKYRALGLTSEFTNAEGHRIRRIQDWTKRNDHRHHAMDALTVAFTRRSHIQWLNYLNARKDENHKQASSIRGIEHKELYRDERNRLRFKPPMPLDDFRKSAKEHLEATLISHKAKNKVVTRNKNKTKKVGGITTRIELSPRGALHQETIYGSHIAMNAKEEKISGKFNAEKIAHVAKKSFRDALHKRLKEFDNDPKKAFTGSNSLEKKPVYLNDLHTGKVPEIVKLIIPETVYTIRKPVGPELNVDKVIDPKIKKILENRIKEFGDNIKLAFANLEDNPIWLNKEKGIKIKRVKISGISNAESLHFKKDKEGQSILDDNQNRIPVDFVNTGSNHHVAIYEDEKGNLQENVVSFFEAVARKNQELPIVDKTFNKDKNWKFLFTLKQNELFVIPNEATGFNPIEVDLLDEANYKVISPNLFRVQKVTNKDYFFRHHLETILDDRKELQGKTWLRIGPKGLSGFLKIRVNHLGKIVSVGEY